MGYCHPSEVTDSSTYLVLTRHQASALIQVESSSHFDNPLPMRYGSPRMDVLLLKSIGPRSQARNGASPKKPSLLLVIWAVQTHQINRGTAYGSQPENLYKIVLPFKMRIP